MRNRIRIASVLFLLCLVAAPGSAIADSPSLAETLQGEAKTEYEAGRLLYIDGDPASALLKFQAAYELSRDVRLLWNQAACAKELREYAQVEALLKRYLNEGGATLTSEDRAEAERLLDAVQPFIVDLVFDVDEAGAAVRLDDRLVATTPVQAPIRVDMGTRHVVITKQGYSPFEQTLTLTGGHPAKVTAYLEREVHEGVLRIYAAPGETIRVDGKTAGVGTVEQTLPSGSHTVEITAPGKLPYRSEIVIEDNQTDTVRVTLEERPVSSKRKFERSWWWAAGGTVLATGLGIGAYYAFRPDEPDRPAAMGTLAPGSISLGLRSAR